MSDQPARPPIPPFAPDPFRRRYGFPRSARRRRAADEPGPESGSALLLESGDFLLLESGDFLLLET